LGFKVAGWSRTPKEIDEIQTFFGDDQLVGFLAKAQILVCLLPLTLETRNILNRNTFNKLPKGAYVINVARGDHLVDQDLLDALENGQLAGACLDVFRIEPLPENHPFWHHPDIRITPHISSLTDPAAVAPVIYDNYRRLTAGLPLLNQIDVESGY
jgi:glyoxylate/hydroxypyruvate reductase A